MPEEKKSEPEPRVQEVVINNELINNKLNALFGMIQEEVVVRLEKLEKKL